MNKFEDIGYELYKVERRRKVKIFLSYVFVVIIYLLALLTTL
jgi:hypothetical protein